MCRILKFVYNYVFLICNKDMYFFFYCDIFIEFKDINDRVVVSILFYNCWMFNNEKLGEKFYIKYIID